MKLKLHGMKTLLLILAILILVCAVAVLSVNTYVKKTAGDYIFDSEDDVHDEALDCILILGCGVDTNGNPTPMLSDRLKRGIQLYKSGVAPKILMSGDHGRNDYDEVGAMREYAIANGVPEEDVFTDHAGFSTYESMYRARDVFKVSKMIIVTQKYHLYRSVYIARKLGMEAAGVDSDYRTYVGQNILDIREVMARCKDFVKCIFAPEPTYLGEPVPVNGDGRQSLG